MTEAASTPLTMGEAIALCLADRLSQSDAARRLGLSQPTVNQWVNGTTKPRLDHIVALEEICRRPRGFVLRAAGYVEDPETFDQLLAARVELDDAGRSVVLAAYHGVVDHYRLLGERGSDPADAGEPE